VFRESTLTPTEIANHLRDELKRMRRRRQLIGDDMTSQSRHTPSPPMIGSPFSPAEFMMDASSSHEASRNVTHELSASHEASHRKPTTSAAEKPVFTLKQMTLICERMCKVN
jgi:hypothetical protein